MVQLGHVWAQVGRSMRNLVLRAGIWRRSWAQDKPNVGNMAIKANVALGPHPQRAPSSVGAKANQIQVEAICLEIKV